MYNFMIIFFVDGERVFFYCKGFEDSPFTYADHNILPLVIYLKPSLPLSGNRKTSEK